MKRLGTFKAVWVSAAALALAMAFAAPARADGPTGAVGWSQQWQGAAPFAVDIHAKAGSAHLATAQVLINDAPTPVSTDGGTTITTAPLPLCPAADPDCDVGGMALTLNTSAWAPGLYHFVVVAKDVANQASNIADGTLTIQAPPANNSSATLTIGSGVTIPEAQPNGGQGGVQGASASSCTQPRLSMLLSQKPVRIKHKVPVLYKNKKYTFTGRLTCVVNDKRHSAAKKTEVEVYAIVKGKSVHKATMRVASGGKLTVKVASPSTRTLEFRFKADGKTTRVRIKITIVKAPKKHTKHHT